MSLLPLLPTRGSGSVSGDRTEPEAMRWGPCSQPTSRSQVRFVVTQPHYPSLSWSLPPHAQAAGE